MNTESNNVLANVCRATLLALYVLSCDGDEVTDPPQDAPVVPIAPTTGSLISTRQVVVTLRVSWSNQSICVWVKDDQGRYIGRDGVPRVECNLYIPYQSITSSVVSGPLTLPSAGGRFSWGAEVSQHWNAVRNNPTSPRMGCRIEGSSFVVPSQHDEPPRPEQGRVVGLDVDQTRIEVTTDAGQVRCDDSTGRWQIPVRPDELSTAGLRVLTSPHGDGRPIFVVGTTRLRFIATDADGYSGEFPEFDFREHHPRANPSDCHTEPLCPAGVCDLRGDRDLDGDGRTDMVVLSELGLFRCEIPGDRCTETPADAGHRPRCERIVLSGDPPPLAGSTARRIAFAPSASPDVRAPPRIVLGVASSSPRGGTLHICTLTPATLAMSATCQCLPFGDDFDGRTLVMVRDRVSTWKRNVAYTTSNSVTVGRLPEDADGTPPTVYRAPRDSRTFGDAIVSGNLYNDSTPDLVVGEPGDGFDTRGKIHVFVGSNPDREQFVSARTGSCNDARSFGRALTIRYPTGVGIGELWQWRVDDSRGWAEIVPLSSAPGENESLALGCNPTSPDAGPPDAEGHDAQSDIVPADAATADADLRSNAGIDVHDGGDEDVRWIRGPFNSVNSHGGMGADLNDLRALLARDGGASLTSTTVILH